MMSLDLAEVSQCVLPGNNRNEVELQFPESDAIEANNDQLVSIRFYIPPDPEVDPSDRTVKSSAELLQHRIMQMANIRKTTGDVIGTFAISITAFWGLDEIHCLLHIFSRFPSQTSPLLAVEFDLEKGSFLTPRGRYSIELCKCYVWFSYQRDCRCFCTTFNQWNMSQTISHILLQFHCLLLY